MALARARVIALWVLGWTAQAAPRLAIELTPKGPLALEVVAGDREASASLGKSLAQSLGCALSGTAVEADGGEWAFRAACTGSFARRGQALEGTLRFSAFRAPLRAQHIASLAVDVAMPNTPYRNTGFSKNWERALEDGAVHYRRVATPGQLPATVELALGYRQRELETMLAPAGCGLLAALALMVLLHLAVAKRRETDARALWADCLRWMTWGLAAIFVLWATAWAVLSKVFGGDWDAWTLYATWHGWPAILGQAATTLLYCLPALAAAAVWTWRRPAVFETVEDAAWRAILLRALGWIAPAYWTIAAFGSLTIGEPLRAAVRLGIAAALAILLRYLDSGRGTLTGELRRVLSLFGGLTAGMVSAHLVHVSRAALAAPLTMAVAASVVIGMEWWLAVRGGRAATADGEGASLEASPAS